MYWFFEKILFFLHLIQNVISSCWSEQGWQGGECAFKLGLGLETGKSHYLCFSWYYLRREEDAKQDANIENKIPFEN